MPDGPGPVGRCIVDPRWRIQRAQRCAHRSLASGRSGARKLAGGGATKRGKRGELGSGLTGARAALRRPASVVQNGEAVALGERAAQAGREGNRSGERCGEARGGCSPFIGAGGAPGTGGWGG
jgi:hypothetical protein